MQVKRKSSWELRESQPSWLMCYKNLTLFLTKNGKGQARGIMATGKNQGLRVKQKIKRTNDYSHMPNNSCMHTLYHFVLIIWPRLREVEQFVPGHTTSHWQSLKQRLKISWFDYCLPVLSIFHSLLWQIQIQGCLCGSLLLCFLTCLGKAWGEKANNRLGLLTFWGGLINGIPLLRWTEISLSSRYRNQTGEDQNTMFILTWWDVRIRLSI